MHLPQEYWRQKTLYEIAYVLGTPLTIDEATQNRRFGVYVRVLIDVDLSEKLFESVVVERDGHALSIMVQYEKQPAYCVHCKILGHNLQNWSKLSSLNNVDDMVPIRAHPVTNQPKTQAKASLAGKKPVGTFEGPDLAGKNLASTSASTEQQFVVNNQTQKQDNNKDMSADIENVEALSIHEKEGVSVDQTEITVIQKNGDSSMLALRNSFELLVAESELPSGEVMLVDKDITHTSKELLIADNGNVEKVAKGKVGLNQSNNTEVHCELENRSSKFEVLHSNKTLSESANGRLSPISAPLTFD